jgi:enoyl-CoA hydratase/carnithine racemase
MFHKARTNHSFAVPMAWELVFTGKLISAETAAEIGLINTVADDSSLDELVGDCLERVAKQPTENIALAKRALHQNIGQSVYDGLQREVHYQALAYETDGHQEGISAFLEDRELEFNS